MLPVARKLKQFVKLHSIQKETKILKEEEKIDVANSKFRGNRHEQD